jgi:hypothetical protein
MRGMSGPTNADAVGQRILNNKDLVERILDAAKHPGRIMTVDEFKTWLDACHENGLP